MPYVVYDAHNSKQVYDKINAKKKKKNEKQISDQTKTTNKK